MLDRWLPQDVSGVLGIFYLSDAPKASEDTLFHWTVCFRYGDGDGQ